MITGKLFVMNCYNISIFIAMLHKFDKTFFCVQINVS